MTQPRWPLGAQLLTRQVNGDSTRESGFDFHLDVFFKYPPKPPLNGGYTDFCGIELKHTRRFLSLRCYFTVMLTVALRISIGFTPLLLHATDIFGLLRVL
jgi:hypothetical protein